ncbi:MAG: hypothetical protein AABY53_09030 [Bdellovibrionota bacterium]
MKPVLFSLIFSLIFSVLFTTQAIAREIVVLVPGFFNSFAPEYFSRDIIKSIEKKGFKVYVAEGLNPIGTIEENGERLSQVFAKIEVLEKNINKNTPALKTTFNVIAHSAGGFYTLFVANQQKYDIKNILTISTPYKGIEFIQSWLDDSLIFSLLTDLAQLDGVVQLTQSGVAKFLSSVRVSPKTKIVAFAGYQEESFDVWDARNLSAPLRVTSYYISDKSDGIVSYTSALAVGSILTTENLKATQLQDPNYFLALEHWEQVLESDSFIFLGIRNTDYIREEQLRFYSALTDYLLKIL